MKYSLKNQQRHGQQCAGARQAKASTAAEGGNSLPPAPEHTDSGFDRTRQLILKEPP